MIRGGISDKLGNAYEALWLSQHLLRVFAGLRGKAVQLEPLGVNGFEFTYETSVSTEWHQCKTRSTGSWTINALCTNGVLGHFKTRLTASETNHCVFVSDTGVQHFDRLCRAACMAGDFRGFLLVLDESKDAQQDFSSVCTTWAIDEAQAYAWLRRCRASTVAAYDLDQQLRDLINIQFHTPVQTVLDRLAGLGVEELTRRLDTEQLRALLLEDGVRPRDYALNPTVGERMDHATRQYLSTIESSMPLVSIPRTEVAEEIGAWHADNDRSGLLVIGAAGAGKSHVLAHAIETLQSAGTRVLAFRADRYLDCSTVEQLGESLIREAVSPRTALAQVARTGKPVLVIDQLDAVSQASGRKRAVKDIILDLAKRNELTDHVKVILACRAYDLSGDQEFTDLTNKQDFQSLTLSPLAWDMEIAPALRNAGYDLSRFSSDQVALLSVPVHLSTFLKLNPPGSPHEDFSSGGDLIVRLIERTDEELADAGEGWSAWTALGDVAERMSENQLLAAPSAILDKYRNGRRRLCSTGLLTESGNQIQFGHESYFDLIFARRFQASGERVGVWLSSSEQSLFRRTQIRQILEYLRAEDPGGGYLSALADVIASSGVRYLVKDAAVRWLADRPDPSDAEMDVVLAVADPTRPNQLMRRAFGSTWFPLIERRGLIDTWLQSDDENVRRLAINYLSRAFEAYPEDSSSALRRLLDSGFDHAPSAALSVLRFATPGEKPETLTALYAEMIGGLDVEALRNEVYNHANFYHWQEDHSALAIDLIGLELERWLSLDPAADPFVGDGMQDNQVPHAIQEIAKQAPAAFLRRIAPLYAETLRRIATGETGHDGRSADRMFTKSFSRRERWGGLLLSCLPQAAQTDPEAIHTIYSHFDAANGAVGLHFLLEAISVKGDIGASVFASLIDHAGLFDADHDGEEWLPAAKAALASRPYLSTEDWRRFEARLFDYRPEHISALRNLELTGQDPEHWPDGKRYALRGLTRTGEAVWRVLSMTGREIFSKDRQPHIDELIRKFGNLAWRERRERTARTVVSPISVENAKRMSNEAWLSAIDAYKNDEREFYRESEGDTTPGGASSLASLLEGLTRAEPERFVSLLEKILPTANPIYAQRILDGLRTKGIDPQLVIRAFKAAQPFWNERLLASLGLLVRAVPHATEDPLVFDAIVNLATNGDDPSRTTDDRDGEIRGALRLEDLFDRGSRAHFSSSGADRNVGWDALAIIASENSDQRAAIAEILDSRIDEETNSDVLPSMADAAVSLLKFDRERAIEMLCRIARKDIRVVSEFTTPRIYNWLLWQDWERFAWIVENMLVTSNEVLRGLAFMWLAARYFDNGDFADRLAAVCASDSLASRAVADIAHEYIAQEQPSLSALNWLLENTDHSDPIVVKQVFDANWALILDRGGPLLELADRLIDSPHFGDNAVQFIFALDDRPKSHPILALRTARRVIDIARSENRDPDLSDRDLSLHNLGKLVTGAAEAFAERGEASHEALDLIDDFLTLDHYSVNAELKKYDAR